MQIRVIDEAQNVLWVKTESGGMTSLSYRRDGTLEKIIAALGAALTQARGELGAHKEIDGDVAAQNSAALETMLKRQFGVDVDLHPIPNAGRLKERAPLRRGSEVGFPSGLPYHCNVTG